MSARHLRTSSGEEPRRLAPGGDAARVWRLQYGPCWCRGTPSETGSFDFVRLATSSPDLGEFEGNILIISDRVIDGSRPVYREVYERVPDPKLVIATRSCPAAARFWDELPIGWVPAEEVLPVDISVDECVTGHPEALMAAVISHVHPLDPDSESEIDVAVSLGA